ncbi:hypothetical protein K469DRAFT_700028 [Zopfia rhizophila CBS 207.26]|uniref:Uncharacterized protein n=1 Tax=Zopfia rhizophila CBS 207.26 TaxID=1314779 RepID=A0A6A6DCX5_9PEZI|nr:hypothetical protein K469DRAFT_700028 [Zopfia rhizophila CBS 207.26]
MGAFSGFWIIFLSTQRTSPPSPSAIDAIHLTGGPGFQPPNSALKFQSWVSSVCLQLILYP